MEQNPAQNKRALDDFRRMAMAAHYTVCATRARAAGMRNLAARELTSLLRYVGIVPADRVRRFSYSAVVSGSGNVMT
jgi:hypothetical protein